MAYDWHHRLQADRRSGLPSPSGLYVLYVQNHTVCAQNHMLSLTCGRRGDTRALRSLRAAQLAATSAANPPTEPPAMAAMLGPPVHATT